MILCLETTSHNCSVAVYSETESVVMEEQSEKYIHSEKLHLFIDEVIRQAGIRPSDLKAVAVSRGPGSYTGLRIGVATAKGVCYALGIPLIAVNTLEVLARTAQIQEGELAIPVMDARRMEVYSQVFDHDFNPLREIRAEIVDATAFAEYRAGKELHLIGDGALKCRDLLGEDGLHYHPANLPSAAIMGPMAQSLLEADAIEDVAYFEPFYLKDFQAGAQKA